VVGGKFVAVIQSEASVAPGINRRVRAPQGPIYVLKKQAPLCDYSILRVYLLIHIFGPSWKMTFQTLFVQALAFVAVATAQAPVDQLVGYGAGTTGGGPGPGTTVSSCSQLSAALANGGVIKVNGMLSGCGILRPISNTSIIGVGSNSGMMSLFPSSLAEELLFLTLWPGLSGGGFYVRRVSNIIIRNMRFNVAPSKADAVGLDAATQVWIDHCDFNTKGMTGGKDDYDGLLDITHGSDYVTVSWNKFHDHVRPYIQYCCLAPGFRLTRWKFSGKAPLLATQTATLPRTAAACALPIITIHSSISTPALHLFVLALVISIAAASPTCPPPESTRAWEPRSSSSTATSRT
jgi:hypothetical protein